MNTRRRLLTSLATCLVVIGSACGGSDNNDNNNNNDNNETSTIPDSGGGGDEPAGEPAASSDPAVEDYCSAVEEYAVGAQELIDDPLNADVEAITALGLELAATSAELGTSLSGADLDRLGECNEIFSSIGT